MPRVALLRCPVCGAPLATAEKVYRCPRGHAFDVARQGYVNLLARGGRVRGDPLWMLRARRAFLEGGYYDALAERLIRHVDEASQSLNREQRVLDAGCGEGFYLRRLEEASGESRSLIRCGIDISRAAIRLAAQRDRDGLYAVGSIHELPVMEASVDVVLSVFAHRSFAEFARVLRRPGLLVCVHPGPDHLIELRRLLYVDTRFRRQRTQRPVRHGPLRRIGYERLRYLTNLSTERDLLNLLAMTPFGAHAPKSGRENVRWGERFPLTIDFVITQFKAG